MRSILLLTILCLLVACGGREDRAKPVKIAYTELSLFNHGPSRTLVGLIDSVNKLSLSFPIAGKISTVTAELGESVSQDQQLAALAVDQFSIAKANAEANLDAVREQLKMAGEKLKLTEQMLNANVGSKKDYDAAAKKYQELQLEVTNKEQALQVADQQLNRTILRSPKAGLIAKRQVAPHDFVGVGQVLFELHPEGSLRMQAKIPEEILKYVAKDDPVQMNILDTKQTKLTGKIISLEPVPVGSNAAFALIMIDNQAGLRAGMKGELMISIQDKSAPVWWLPKNIVINWSKGSDAFVYLYLAEKSIIQQRAVKVDKENGDFVEVVSGLSLGDKIVTQAATTIKDGQRVTAVGSSEIPKYAQKQLELP